MDEQFNSPRPRRRSPAQRNRALQGRWLSWLLIGCVVTFVILGLLLPDNAFSESENRSLAQFPKPSLGTLADGSWLKDLGNYASDQFPLRDQWMSLNLAMNQLLGQKEAGGVYLCQDDCLMQIPAEPNISQHKRNMEAVNAFAKAHKDVNMVMSVVPNAVTVHADKLPDNAPVRDQTQDLKNIQKKLEGVAFADVTAALKDRSDDYLFYRTDHHWTSLGAYYAFTAIAPSLSIEAPAKDSYTVHRVSDAFEGTLSSKSGSHKTTDTVEIYVPDTDVEYFVTYNQDASTNICSLYSRKALETKDHYTVFFGGNHPRVDISTSADTGRSLLIFKDSYANCFIQFLYPYFDHITMIDPRYYYDQIEPVMNSEGITDVLFLYNADTFLSDTSLADVLTTE